MTDIQNSEEIKNHPSWLEKFAILLPLKSRNTVLKHKSKTTLRDMALHVPHNIAVTEKH